MRIIQFEDRYYRAINMMQSFVSFLHYYHIKYAGLDQYAWLFDRISELIYNLERVESK